MAETFFEKFKLAVMADVSPEPDAEAIPDRKASSIWDHVRTFARRIRSALARLFRKLA